MRRSTLLLAAVLISFSAVHASNAAGCDTEMLKKMIRKARKEGTLLQFYETAPSHCPEYGAEGLGVKVGRERLERLVNDVRRESEFRQGGGGLHH